MLVSHVHVLSICVPEQGLCSLTKVVLVPLVPLAGFFRIARSRRNECYVPLTLRRDAEFGKGRGGGG